MQEESNSSDQGLDSPEGSNSSNKEIRSLGQDRSPKSSGNSQDGTEELSSLELENKKTTPKSSNSSNTEIRSLEQDRSPRSSGNSQDGTEELSSLELENKETTPKSSNNSNNEIRSLEQDRSPKSSGNSQDGTEELSSLELENKKTTPESSNSSNSEIRSLEQDKSPKSSGNSQDGTEELSPLKLENEKTSPDIDQNSNHQKYFYKPGLNFDLNGESTHKTHELELYSFEFEVQKLRFRDEKLIENHTSVALECRLSDGPVFRDTGLVDNGEAVFGSGKRATFCSRGDPWTRMEVAAVLPDTNQEVGTCVLHLADYFHPLQIKESDCVIACYILKKNNKFSAYLDMRAAIYRHGSVLQESEKTQCQGDQCRIVSDACPLIRSEPRQSNIEEMASTVAEEATASLEDVWDERDVIRVQVTPTMSFELRAPRQEPRKLPPYLEDVAVQTDKKKKLKSSKKRK